MKKFFIIILITISYSLLYSQDNYNLNEKFRIIEKFDNILSSDNKEYIFYVDANYIFSDEGKSIYSNNIYDMRETIKKLKKSKADTSEKKILLDNDISIYESLLNLNTPPKNFIYFLINRQLHNYISKYHSNYIDKMINNDLEKFYDNIKNNIILNEKYTGIFTSIKFLTKDKFKIYTGRT